ncbi:MAG: hypothetical protein CMK07_12735, partial [Ponticaulis sp.]|nr:hypothetical protein [Ponticaulis sp.]
MHETARPSLKDARPFQRQSVLDRKTIRIGARVIDILGLCFLTLFAMSGLSGSFLDVPLGVAIPYLVLPIVTVWGMWSAGAYRFAFTERILDHLAKVLLGGGLSIAAIYGVSLIFDLGGSQLYLAGSLLVGGVTLTAAHAHHVSWMKHLIRNGSLSENV